MIKDCAIYVEGARQPGALPIEGALAAARAAGGFVWVGLHEPGPDEFEDVAREFGLHPLAVEDAIHAHQRPKLERYGDTLFLVLKPTRYVDHEEVIEVEQLMLFVGEAFVVTVRHGGSSVLRDVRTSQEATPGRLSWGPTAVVHAVADRVVDEYGGVLRDLDVDIDEIAEQVFAGPRTAHAARIFNLKREVLDFRRAVDALGPPLEELSAAPPPIDERAVNYFRDVHDHLIRAMEHLAGLDALLDSVLNTNVVQVGMRQNEDMRKISAWVAIVAVPTMIAGVYGMNFAHMPELEWRYGYPMALAGMALACTVLYRAFKRRDWL